MTGSLVRSLSIACSSHPSPILAMHSKKYGEPTATVIMKIAARIHYRVSLGRRKISEVALSPGVLDLYEAIKLIRNYQ